MPTKDDKIFWNNFCLADLLKKISPELMKMEDERIDILYSVSPVEHMPASVLEQYKEHLAATKKRYQELELPQYLIVCGNDTDAYELITTNPIVPAYSAALGVRSVSFEEARKYFTESNYEEVVKNYFSAIKKSFYDNDSDPFSEHLNFNVLKIDTKKEDSIEVYLDGKIRGIPIKGSFEGIVKIKRY